MFILQVNRNLTIQINVFDFTNLFLFMAIMHFFMTLNIDAVHTNMHQNQSFTKTTMLCD